MVVRNGVDGAGAPLGLNGAQTRGGTQEGDRSDRPIRRVTVFTVVALALLMMSVDSTIVATALHSLQHGLDTSINWAGWTITAYSFGFLLMLPISGRLSERLGRRKVFLGSVIVFTAASLACGLASDIYTLIALRAVQAIGGAGFTPSATGIVVDHFGAARDRALGLFGSIFPIGIMIGPIFGGLIVSNWGWREIFFVNVPIGIAIIVLAILYIPRDRPLAKSSPLALDGIGMALLGAGLFGGMLAASYLGEADSAVSGVIALAASLVALAALLAFFHHIRRSPRPFIKPEFIHGKGFGAVNLINAIYGGVRSGVIVLVPLYAANRYGIDALGAGTLLIAEGIAAIVLSVSAAFLLRRTGHRPPIYAGAAAITLGVGLLAIPPVAGVMPYVWLAAATFLIGVGTGVISPASRNAGLQLAPESSSTLAALRTMSLQIGQIVTVSIVTTMLAAAADPATAQAWAFVAIAALLAVVLPTVHRVPEHRGSW